MPAGTQKTQTKTKGAKASESKPLPPIKKNDHKSDDKKKGRDSDFAELDSLFRCL
jgi:hypothetical protein